jgi:hypothetical protein
MSPPAEDDGAVLVEDDTIVEVPCDGAGEHDELARGEVVLL